MLRMGSCCLDHETRKTIVESSGAIFPGAMVLKCPSGETVIAPAQPSISYVEYLCQVPTATEHDADLINGVPDLSYTKLSAYYPHFSVFTKGNFCSMRFQAPRKIDVTFYLPHGETSSTP